MIRIGVIGTANIAERRMIPAILKMNSIFKYVGASISTKTETGFNGSSDDFKPVYEKKEKKAKHFESLFGGKTYNSYTSMIEDKEIDALYIALPPALHYRWASLAISCGKHVILEKPFTTNYKDTLDLLNNAKKNNVALFENYGFCYHSQMKRIEELIENNMIGDIRIIRAAFGFPHREENDFRYNKQLGGGALLDCGGYTVKAATEILGPNVFVLSANSVTTLGHEVDIYGSATLSRSDGLSAQVAYGMDNSYKCELEIWGKKGVIYAPRIFTAPDDFEAKIFVKSSQEEFEESFKDDQFVRVLEQFEKSISSESVRLSIMDEILLQSDLIERINNENRHWREKIV